VTDDPVLGDTIREYLTEGAIEVIPVRDSTVALGVLQATREIDLLMTEVAVPEGAIRPVALMVRPIVHGVGFVFMTGRPQLLDTAGEARDKRFVKSVDPAELVQEIRHRLAE
jgi:DNA-binding response OmpR family regulator